MKPTISLKDLIKNLESGACLARSEKHPNDAKAVATEQTELLLGYLRKTENAPSKVLTSLKCKMMIAGHIDTAI